MLAAPFSDTRDMLMGQAICRIVSLMRQSHPEEQSTTCSERTSLLRRIVRPEEPPRLDGNPAVDVRREDKEGWPWGTIDAEADGARGWEDFLVDVRGESEGVCGVDMKNLYIYYVYIRKLYVT